jgi:hypothetical protein
MNEAIEAMVHGAHRTLDVGGTEQRGQGKRAIGMRAFVL